VFEREECAPKQKSSKECLTVKCCGNADGNYKAKLVVIRKAKKITESSVAARQCKFLFKTEGTDFCQWRHRCKDFALQYHSHYTANGPRSDRVHEMTLPG
jgi:hypothetical protein